MSLRKRIDEKCKDCICDPTAPGTWRQQVFLCSAQFMPIVGRKSQAYLSYT